MYNKIFCYTFFILLANNIDYIHSQFLELQNLASYKPCWTDSPCNVNSFCFGNDNGRPGVCKCLDGFELWRERTSYECFQAKKAGEACIYDHHCQVILGDLGECDQITRVCGCRQDVAHVGRDGKCYKTAKLTEPCISDDNCLLSTGQYAFCNFGHCDCNLKERPTADKRNCVVSKYLGEVCSRDSECQGILNAVCRVMCECSVGSTISMDGQKCLRAATEFGQPCEEDEQCSKFLIRSICTNGTCGCHQGYHSYLNTCFTTVSLGNVCREKGECLHDKSFETSLDCKEGVCLCVPGAKYDGCKSTGYSFWKSVSNLSVIILVIICTFSSEFVM